VSTRRASWSPVDYFVEALTVVEVTPTALCGHARACAPALPEDDAIYALLSGVRDYVRKNGFTAP